MASHLKNHYASESALTCISNFLLSHPMTFYENIKLGGVVKSLKGRYWQGNQELGPFVRGGGALNHAAMVCYDAIGY